MILDHSLEREARKSLKRILPRVEQTLKDNISKDPQGWNQFTVRLQKNFPSLFNLYFEIYNDRYDFFLSPRRPAHQHCAFMVQPSD